MTNNEEIKEEGAQEAAEDPKENSDDRSVGETTPLIDGANKAAERLEQANKVQEELLNRQEALLAKQALGGRSEAGQGPVKTEEESDQDYFDKVQKGEINPLNLD